MKDGSASRNPLGKSDIWFVVVNGREEIRFDANSGASRDSARVRVIMKMNLVNLIY